MKLFGKPLELLILDVDGTLLDLWACFRQNLVTAARRLSLPIKPIDEYLTNVRLGTVHGEAALSDGIRKFWPWLNAEQAAIFEKNFRDAELENPYPVVSGILETIQWFRERGVPLALCTTNDWGTLEHRLRSAGIDPLWFTEASTAEDGYRKPDPRALDPIFTTVPVPRIHAAYVGDWYPDIGTARGGGVRFIAVLSGGIPRQAFLREGVPEDHILERLADLPKLITE